MKNQLHAYKYSFANSLYNSDSTDIYIDGYIVDSPTKEILSEYYSDETSVSFKSFRDQILQSPKKQFNIIINSGGGHVGDAMAIHDLIAELENKGYQFTTKIIGICASATTYIGMSTKNSEISENSWFMIHTVSGGIWGDVDMIENYAATMRKFNNRIVQFYSQRTGISETVISNMMKKETWLTGPEAVAQGFIKNLTPSADFKNKINPDHWQFANKEVLNFYNSTFNNQKKQNEMDLKKLGQDLINSITKAFGEKGVTIGENDPAITNLQNSITQTLENSLNGFTQEKIQEMVNNAIAEATKGDAEALKNVVSEATKDFATKEDLKNLVSEEKVGKMIGDHLGNRSEGSNDSDDKKKNAPKNRFSNVEWFPGNK